MKKTLLLILACCFLTEGTANGGIILEFNSSPGLATVLNDANAGQDATISLGSGVVSGSNLDFLGVSAITDLGNSFTFDAIVSPAGNSTGIGVAATNGSLFEGASPFGTGDGLVISISNISDPNIIFDGFTNFGTDFSGTGEGFTINNITYLRGTATNGDNDPRRGIILPGGTSTVPGLLAQNNVQVDFVGGTVALRGFAIQFTDTTVPEPTSMLMFLGIGLTACVRRRSATQAS